jgi:predicted amidophosphoribosyltransferase
MSLLICKLCGKAFNSMGAKLCASCADEIDKSYMKARRYLYQNPNKKSFKDVIDATGITEKVLSYLIDNGRIVIEAGSNKGVRCRACGVITDGRSLCEKCRTKLASENLLKMRFSSVGGGDRKTERSGNVSNNNNIEMLKRGRQDED